MAIRSPQENGNGKDQFGFSKSDYKGLAEGYIAYHVARREELFGLSQNAALDELVRERMFIGVQRGDLDKVYQNPNLQPSEYPRALAEKVTIGRVEMQRDLRIWFRTDIEEWEYRRARRLTKWQPSSSQ